VTERARRKAHVAKFLVGLSVIVTAGNLAVAIALAVTGSWLVWMSVALLVALGYWDTRLIAEVCLHGWDNSR
jgi:hypothetical protein